MASAPVDTRDLEAVRKIIEAVGEVAPAERERVLRWAAEKLGLAPPAAGGPAPATSSLAPPRPEIPEGPGQDIRSFIAAKAPNSDVQRAVTVAYFLQFLAPGPQRREAIGADDLREGCRRAGIPQPKSAIQALNNALAMGYLDRAGRGVFRVNAVGENLVAMTLPSAGNGLRDGGDPGRGGNGPRGRRRGAEPKRRTAARA